jgi:cardiolipin synthase
MLSEHSFHVLAWLAAGMAVLGIASAFSAILTARTPQGSIAWALALVGFPYVAVPLYWIFGRRRFHGYVEQMRANRKAHLHEIEQVSDEVCAHRVALPPDRKRELGSLEKLVQFPFTSGNSIRVLIDGREAFDAMFAAIAAAREYVFAQFFIVRDDLFGREFAAVLAAKAREGVRVHLLYDRIGSFHLSKRYVNDLRAAGVRVEAFKTTRGPKNRFQLNFRNHRKILVTDGTVAFVGGLNVGDEYLGRHGPWRDTHARIEGPAVQCIQAAFLADWFWATDDWLPARWSPTRSKSGDCALLVLPTSPADLDETCALFFHQAIASAKKRVWIASPYFVPDAPVFEALRLAALRGVDVRVLLPEKPDHLFVWLASFSFLPDAERVGIQVLRYTRGFLHEKVILVDDDVAAVGSANLDNRSMRLNFEIMVLAVDPAFAKEVERMLERDLEHARLAAARDHHSKRLPFRLAVRVAQLLEPIL